MKRTLLCATTLLLGLPAAAWGEGYDLDPELVHSSFSFHAMPGIDSPTIDGQAGMRVGTLLQLEQDPLVLYMGDEDEASIVGTRGDVQLGFSYDWNKRLSTRMVVPLAFQGSGDMPELAAAGFGMRNLSLGGRAGLADTELLDVAARADILLPTGTRGRYMGETSPRVELGFLLASRFGPVEATIDAGYSGATTVETDYDLHMGSEAVANAGLRAHLIEDRFAVGAAVLSRSGAKTTLEPGGARVEGLAVMQAWFGPSLQLDLGAGRGLSKGYGTSGARFMLGLTWIKAAFVPELVPIEIDDDPGLTLNGRSIEPELPDEPEEDIEWKHGELARVEVHRQTISIRDDIKFEVGSSRILPESLPVLDQVAELMASYWQIDHLVIEGHASEEGEYDVNFMLSIERARSIYKTLVESGVHPARLSFRGFGEVDPKDTGESEAQLASNRRVEFHIVRQLEALEVPPEYPSMVRLPWTGEIVPVRQASERLLGQDIEYDVPVGPDEDDQAVDLMREMLDEGDDEPEGDRREPDARRLQEYQEEIPSFDDDLLDDDEQPAEDRP
jgi:outer membrane protein OmpA-like peptidoglycan-associated protein